MYDIIIIGAGPAGISAGIYAVSRGKRTLILEKNKVGGIIGNVSAVTHYSAIVSGETGETFAKRLKDQALAAGVELKYENVLKAELTGEVKKIYTADNCYEAAKVILANGSSPRRLGVPGEIELIGKGVAMNAVRDGKSYEGKCVYVVGGADGAVKEALYLSQFASEVTIICVEPALACIAEFKNKALNTSNIKVRPQSHIAAFYGDGKLESFDLVSDMDGHKETITDPECGIFTYVGLVPNTQLYTELELEGGYIPVNEKMQTAIPGVYAAGDIRVKQVRQAATAVADGAIAAINAAM